MVEITTKIMILLITVLIVKRSSEFSVEESGGSPRGCFYDFGEATCDFDDWRPPLSDSDFGNETIYGLTLKNIDGNIPHAAFSGLHGPPLHELQNLIFNETYIVLHCVSGQTRLVKGIFTSNLRWVQRLSIKNCNLRGGLPNGLFQNLTSLKILEFKSGRIIGKLRNGSLRGLENLQKLLINSVIPGGNYPAKFLTHVPNVITVDFKSSRLDFIRADAFRQLLRLQSLDLSDNKIQTLPSGIFERLHLLRNVWLTDNPWNCDCDLLWILDWSDTTDILIKVVCEAPMIAQGYDLDNVTSLLNCTTRTTDTTMRTVNITASSTGQGPQPTTAFITPAVTPATSPTIVTLPETTATTFRTITTLSPTTDSTPADAISTSTKAGTPSITAVTMHTTASSTQTIPDSNSMATTRPRVTTAMPTTMAITATKIFTTLTTTFTSMPTTMATTPLIQFSMSKTTITTPTTTATKVPTTMAITSATSISMFNTTVTTPTTTTTTPMTMTTAPAIQFSMSKTTITTPTTTATKVPTTMAITSSTSISMSNTTVTTPATKTTTPMTMATTSAIQFSMSKTTVTTPETTATTVPTTIDITSATAVSMSSTTITTPTTTTPTPTTMAAASAIQFSMSKTTVTTPITIATTVPTTMAITSATAISMYTTTVVMPESTANKLASKTSKSGEIAKTLIADTSMSMRKTIQPQTLETMPAVANMSMSGTSSSGKIQITPMLRTIISKTLTATPTTNINTTMSKPTSNTNDLISGTSTAMTIGPTTTVTTFINDTPATPTGITTSKTTTLMLTAINSIPTAEESGTGVFDNVLTPLLVSGLGGMSVLTAVGVYLYKCVFQKKTAGRNRIYDDGEDNGSSTYSADRLTPYSTEGLLPDSGSSSSMTRVGEYSITSMARTRMARLPWMIRTRFSVPTKSFQ